MAHLLQGQIPRAALNFRFFADYIGQTEGDLYTQNSDFLTFVRRDPVGVAALIGPWNAPLALLTMKAAAAIAFGNSCVVKPSEQTPLTMFAMMNLLKEAGVPDGVVNLVNGSGSVTGSALPVTEPEPFTRLTTPSGTPASFSKFIIANIVKGVCSEGLTTQLLPKAIAAAAFIVRRASGAFQGPIRAATPTGSLLTNVRKSEF